ncbi:hypothetical protein B7494_g925 [Chlorociboria aeruginascens]|nr:hypothetical protein B7494_g925 [Chlorociboria aeruginascens]
MALLESVFNHLVLPPKLPGHRDKNVEGIRQSILTRLICACDTVGQHTGRRLRETWASVHYSLRICLNNPSRLEKASLNAGLLVRRRMLNNEDIVIFEVFEASPPSEDVLAAENALQWDFPGHTVGIPFREFAKKDFQESFAAFLEQASVESLKRFEACSATEEDSVIEAQDTTNPALLTQILMPLLEAVGSAVKVPRFRKRVRDDINTHSAEFPWGRLLFWLVLRVVLHRQLGLIQGDEPG